MQVRRTRPSWRAAAIDSRPAHRREIRARKVQEKTRDGCQKTGSGRANLPARWPVAAPADRARFARSGRPVDRRSAAQRSCWLARPQGTGSSSRTSATAAKTPMLAPSPVLDLNKRAPAQPNLAVNFGELATPASGSATVCSDGGGRHAAAGRSVSGTSAQVTLPVPKKQANYATGSLRVDRGGAPERSRPPLADPPWTVCSPGRVAPSASQLSLAGPGR
jgi:hypothetical protein